MLREEYKGWVISYDEENENFRAENNDDVVEDSKLKGLKKKIDNFNVVREKIFFDDYGKLTEGEITSKVGDNHYRVSYMHKGSGYYSGKDRKTWTKIRFHKIFKYDENNKKIFEQVHKRHEQIDNLNKEIKGLESNLTSFKGPIAPESG